MHEHKLPSEVKTEARTILEKANGSTDPSFGCEPHKRPVAQLLQYGIVIVNKPEGPTSHQVSAYVQRILQIDKAGHSGTLDPGVTGVLPVALESATRIVQALLPAGKEYIAIMHLHKPVPQDKLDAAIKKFTGTIRQKPPLRSAVKREVRPRTIYYLDVMEIDGQDVLVRMGCEAGTYVRKWIHDIGLHLGCGAHMQQLIRTKAGPFRLEHAVTLQTLQDAHYYWKEEGNEIPIRTAVLPYETGVQHLPTMWIHDNAVDSLCHGALLHVPGVAKLHNDITIGDMVAVLTLKGELVCLGMARMASKDIVANQRGVALKVDAVLMQPGTYPRQQRNEK
ncbi:MAG: RNA-guided pseudouridylation complex pseudouridine synthase subunit Cbf5 [Nanoarchaeota archaeon]